MHIHKVLIFKSYNSKNINFIFISNYFGIFYYKLKTINLTYFFFNKNIVNKQYYIFLNWQIINNYFLGLLSNYNYKVQVYGSNLKITKKFNTFILRTGKANKHVILPFQNIKLFLIKKTIVQVISRNFNMLKLFIHKWKFYYLKNTYKKKGLYFKNEIVILKTGKVVKL